MSTPVKSKPAAPVPVAAAKKRVVEPVNDDAEPTVLHAPIDVRSTSLVVLAGLAVLYFLYWARPVLIPITTAVMLSYALTPVVRWMEKRLKLHKALGAALTIALILAILAISARALQPQVLNVLDVVPQAAQKFAESLRSKPSEEPGAVEKLKKAATEIEQAAATAAAPPAGASPPPKPQPKVEPATFNLRDYLFTGTAGLVAAAGQFVVVTCLVYFLLVSGDTFRRTLLRVSGDTLTKKKITLQILDEIDLQIQRYLLVQLFTSAMLGAICWAIFLWTGLQDALLWGVVGGILHLIPYVGPFAFVVVISIIAFVQFDNIQPVFVLLGCVITMIGIIGMLLVPWLTGKVGRIKAVTVFLSLLVWGWLWGIWGLLLGVPIVMAINAICERVEDLQPISLFLGYGPDDQAQAAKDVAATT